MKQILLGAFIALSLVTQAQYENNYLQTTQIGSLNGDARYTGLGGAMSAVGSNFSALGNNPAGLAKFVNNELNFGISILTNSTDNLYNGTQNNTFNGKMGIQSYGIAADISSRNTEGQLWFSLSGQRVYDFKNRTVHKGRNIDYTLNEYFADKAYGTVDADLSSVFPFDVSLAFETYLIDPDTVNYDTYSAKIQNENARIENDENGSRFENYVSFGYNRNNKLYLGASVGIHSSSYENQYSYRGDNTNAETEYAQNYTYDYYFNSSSTGVNATVGVIYKPSQVFNFGFSYKTPTAWFIEESFSSTMNAEYTNTEYTIDSEFEGVVTYRANAPSVMNFSAAVTDKQFGLFSVEASKINYTNGKLISPKKEAYIDFDASNVTINTSFRDVWNIKAGYEKPFKRFALRAGINTIPSAYKNGNDFIDYRILNISGGLGVYTNFGRMDFSVTSSNARSSIQPYGGADLATTETRSLLFNFSFTILEL
jgi:hypothetical protein